MKKHIFILSIALFSVKGFCQTMTETTGKAILSATKSNSIVTTSPGSTARTLTSSSVTTSGTVTAGARSVLFEPLIGFVGTLDGQTLTDPIEISADPNGTLPAIPYAITSGTLIIRKLQ